MLSKPRGTTLGLSALFFLQMQTVSTSLWCTNLDINSCWLCQMEDLIQSKEGLLTVSEITTFIHCGIPHRRVDCVVNYCIKPWMEMELNLQLQTGLNMVLHPH